MAVVHIVWNDASSDTDGWTDMKDLDRDPTLVDSVGFLLDPAHTPLGHVAIYQSRIQGTDQIDSVLHIPRAMVRHIKVLFDAV
jgi:hypothetical protein